MSEGGEEEDIGKRVILCRRKCYPVSAIGSTRMVQYQNLRKEISVDEVNIIHWHDASKEKPFALTEKENEGLIIAVGEDDDKLSWYQAFYEKGKWVCHIDVAIDGKEFHFTANYKNVKYWAEFPHVDFKL